MATEKELLASIPSCKYEAIFTRREVVSAFGEPLSPGLLSACSGDGHRFTVPYDPDESEEANHTRAAEGLAQRYGWLQPDFRLIGGRIPQGWAFVLVHFAM